MSEQNKEGLISSVIYQNHQSSTDVDFQDGAPVNNIEIETRFLPPREDKSINKVFHNQVRVNSDDTESEEPSSKQLLTQNVIQNDDSETKCGFYNYQPDWLQKLASKKSYVIVYGILGMFQFTIGSYFIASITTLEKRFKIPSKTSGVMMSAWDIGGVSVTLVLSYLGSKGHKTRWVAAGTILIAFSCFLNAVPHFIFGPGQDALELTMEYGHMDGSEHKNFSNEQAGDYVCRSKYLEEEDCSSSSSSLPPAIFIASFLIIGVGSSMYYTLGIAYMDDNVRKNKSPMMLAISQCIRMIGPTIGYLFASYAFKKYIDISLHPTITSDDPRWIGAWWLGWCPLGVILLILAAAMAFFPKRLPRVAQRMVAKGEYLQRNEVRSFADFKLTIIRLAKNKILLLNSLSAVCFACGFTGYWLFMPKYMETQFRQSASSASLITGSVGLFCSGLGLMTSGIVISKFKPRARYLAAWNVIVEGLEVIGYFSYTFLSCGIDDLHGEMKADDSWNLTAECNVDCDCGPRINYSPICASEGNTTFYSPCHAGCATVNVINGTKIFGNCSCIGTDGQGWAVEGACPVDCTVNFTIFLAIQCILRFLSSSGRAGNTLLQFRCVDPEDKSISISFTEVLLCTLAFIPAPILYGMLLDSACIVWGQTCGQQGNCWLYDSHKLSLLMNTISSAFLLLGTLLDSAVWYYVKDLQIYDDNVESDSKKRKTRG